MSAKERAVSKEATNRVMAILKRKRAELKKAKKEMAALRKTLGKKSHTEIGNLRRTSAAPKKKATSAKVARNKAGKKRMEDRHTAR